MNWGRGHKHSVHNSYEYIITEKPEMYEHVNVYIYARIQVTIIIIKISFLEIHLCFTVM